jgi:hypothetical protein
MNNKMIRNKRKSHLKRKWKTQVKMKAKEKFKNRPAEVYINSKEACHCLNIKNKN